MYAPREIIDFFESIVGIYLSDIRHKERSAFILCDNLVELSCKTRIIERNPSDSLNRDFPRSINDAKLNQKLKIELSKRHKIRNEMQHAKLGITVDNQDCACAIIGVKKVLEKLWGKYSLDQIPDWLICALRIVELYSNSANFSKVKSFEEKLLKDINWSIEQIISIEDSDETNSNRISKVIIKSKRFPNNNEIIIEVGAKNYWALLVREKTELVNQCLDDILKK